MVACGSLLAGSFVVPALTRDDTFDQWRTVFLIYALVLTLSNTIFVTFARFVEVDLNSNCRWPIQRQKFVSSRRDLNMKFCERL